MNTSFVVRNENLSLNFWQANPYFLKLYSKSLEIIYNADKTPDKSESSELMWVSYLAYDLYSSYAHLVLRERINIIENEFLKKKGYFEKNKDKIAIVKAIFDKIQYTSDRKYVDKMNEVLDSRADYISTRSYEEGNGLELDKMIINSPLVYKAFTELQELEAKKEAQKRGNADIGPLQKKEWAIIRREED